MTKYSSMCLSRNMCTHIQIHTRTYQESPANYAWKLPRQGLMGAVSLPHKLVRFQKEPGEERCTGGYWASRRLTVCTCARRSSSISPFPVTTSCTPAHRQHASALHMCARCRWQPEEGIRTPELGAGSQSRVLRKVSALPH